MFDLFFLGIREVMHLDVLFYMFLGVTAGTIAGAIPGFTITMAIILTIPFTFAMEPVAGISTMIGVNIGGLSGGLITAALLGIPGTPSAVATTFDAFPMVKKGLPGQAVSVGIWASFLGSVISMFFLIMFTPQIAGLAMKIGPWEYFSLIVFAMTVIASLTGTSMIKGLMSGCFGMLLATIGLDPIGGGIRLTFNLDFLLAGVPFLVVLIGMFAISRLMTEVEKTPEKTSSGEAVPLGFKLEPLKALKIVLKQPWNLIRSSGLGAFIGAIPGAGASISNLLAYDQAKKASPHPEKFGTGIPDGIIASESGNNATAGGGLIPTIALGLPGSAVSAVMLSALMVHGITPGPLLIRNHPHLVGAIFVAFAVSSFFMLFVQFLGARFFLKITKIPAYVLVPSILALCVIGTYVLNNRFTDLYILVIMGLAGYFLIKGKFPLAPVVLGVILEPLAEVNLRRSLMTENDWSLFIKRPISAIFLVLALLSIILSIWQYNKNKGDNIV